MHCEGGLWTTLYGILFWDILFADVEGAFQTPFQGGPLDYGTVEFYTPRCVAPHRRSSPRGARFVGGWTPCQPPPLDYGTVEFHACVAPHRRHIGATSAAIGARLRKGPFGARRGHLLSRHARCSVCGHPVGRVTERACTARIGALT